MIHRKACTEGGCKRCWDMSVEHGERLDECICIHREESALLEAGKRSVLVSNARFFIIGRLKMESIPLLRLTRYK
jgi:deoxycytidylate deaminase